MEDIVNFANKLWESADMLRDNSELKSTEYSEPVLGLIFLKFANEKFDLIDEQIKSDKTLDPRVQISENDYKKRGVLYIPENSRYSYLLDLPEGEDIGKKVNRAMREIEEKNPELVGILPKNYTILDNDILSSLLKTFSIPFPLEGDAFGKVYEYFLGKFALKEGQGGGEFFTPSSLVQLIVEIIEPIHGKIFDPACGSGGMFVQSAHFVESHNKSAVKEISIYGQEKTKETVKLGKMNLAVNGLSGDIKQGNSYYEDAHDCIDKFDFVMANPPFNGKTVDFDKVKNDPRYAYGMPSAKNANYLWIQQFWFSLNSKGRAGFVMANSASDANHGELEIRKKLIEDNAVDVMVSIGSNFFYNVTLPSTLWFFDKDKVNTSRKDKILFIDARKIFRQIDRAHREFTQEQIEFIANIVRLYRGEEIESTKGSQGLMKENFPLGKYENVLGLCKVATLDEVKEQGYSLNSGRYVGVAEIEEDEDFDFHETLEGLNEELEELNGEAHKLEEQIAENISEILSKK